MEEPETVSGAKGVKKVMILLGHENHVAEVALGLYLDSSIYHYHRKVIDQELRIYDKYVGIRDREKIRRLKAKQLRHAIDKKRNKVEETLTEAPIHQRQEQQKSQQRFNGQQEERPLQEIYYSFKESREEKPKKKAEPRINNLDVRYSLSGLSLIIKSILEKEEITSVGSINNAILHKYDSQKIGFNNQIMGREMKEDLSKLQRRTLQVMKVFKALNFYQESSVNITVTEEGKMKGLATAIQKKLRVSRRQLQQRKKRIYEKSQQLLQLEYYLHYMKEMKSRNQQVQINNYFSLEYTYAEPQQIEKYNFPMVIAFKSTDKQSREFIKSGKVSIRKHQNTRKSIRGRNLKVLTDGQVLDMVFSPEKAEQ